MFLITGDLRESLSSGVTWGRGLNIGSENQIGIMPRLADGMRRTVDLCLFSMTKMRGDKS